jgi:hypothetical protein
VTRDRYQFSAPLPAGEIAVSLDEAEGRGEVRLLEQPRTRNDYSARVLIRDPQSGAGDYSFALSWARPAHRELTPLYSTRGMVWSGRVDGRVRVIVEGRSARVEVLSGAPVTGEHVQFERELPARDFPNATVQRLRGRGSVEIVEFPSRRNDHRLVFEINDSQGGGDNYSVEVGW